MDDNDRKTLEQIAGWLDSNARPVQNAPDEYGYASEFDYQLAQASAEISAILARQPAPVAQPVTPLQALK